MQRVNFKHWVRAIVMLLFVTAFGCGRDEKGETDQPSDRDGGVQSHSDTGNITQNDSSETDEGGGATDTNDASDTTENSDSQTASDTAIDGASDGTPTATDGDDTSVASDTGSAVNDTDFLSDDTDSPASDSVQTATDTAGVVDLSCERGCIDDCPQGCFDMGECQGMALEIHPNIRTAGVVVDDGGESAEGELFYRPAGLDTWFKGHPLVRIPDGTLVGSVFSLSPTMTLAVMVQVAEARFCGTTQTLPDDPIHETIETLYVDGSAEAGGDGTSSAPFNTIQEAINSEGGPGTDIVIRPGLYHEEVRITGGGAENQYLRLLGDPGAILDGSDGNIVAQGTSWTEEENGIYGTPIAGAPSYLSRDGVRLYHYITLDGLLSGVGDDGEEIAEGWFVSNSTLYVRSLDHPDNYVWQIPLLSTAVALDGASWIWIEGLEIRHYGESDYPKGIDVRSSHHVVIRDNHVHATSSPIWVRNGSEYIRIKGNNVHQSGMEDWPWDAVKGTDHEDSGIQISGAGHTIVRENRVGHIFNGIYTGNFDDDQNTQIAFDVDVYDNQLGHIGDDGMEPEGACVNNRFWNNTVDTLHNGISLAPITHGPTWVIGNRFSDYAAGGIKVSNDSSGRVYIYHNTCFTDRPEQNGMTVSGPFENMVFRNNIIRGTRYAFEMSRSALPNDLDYDNFFTTRGAPVMKWDDVRYDSLADMCQTTGLECHGQPDNPALIDPPTGQFGLSEGSPNIDTGIRIYGINDYYTGDGPDIGYREFGTAEPPLY